MDTETLSRRIAGLREECARLGRELAESGQSLSEDEAFELAGQLQGVVNSAEGATALAGAWAFFDGYDICGEPLRHRPRGQ
ncbi:hypothetical protein LG324_04405 [Phycicoccus jejuensis]|uniref:hypothetical protein n=1 Tax=Phycicoccus jejuensis TaxID=367299 RepID=UPI00384F4B2C